MGSGTDRLTCWGVNIYNDAVSYDVTIGKPGQSGYKLTINLTNYTSIDIYNNGKFYEKVPRFISKIEHIVLNLGNLEFVDCGTITGGPCDGDELWSIGIYQADDQEGCSCKGFTGLSALERKIVVKGKCASRCSLGWSVGSWSPPVNNWGAVIGSG